jgi:hypothetical protein
VVLSRAKIELSILKGGAIRGSTLISGSEKQQLTMNDELLKRVRGWLDKHGYPLEMQVASRFREAG